MRGTSDRIRQAVGYELTAFILLTPLGAWLYGHSLADFGVVSIICSVIATIWAYFFNLGFDLAAHRLRGTSEKTLGMRVLHAVAFEGGLVILLVPVVAWSLGVTWAEAFWIDLGVAVFYLGHAFVYYWAYDRVFPLPGTGAAGTVP